ncbi:MAG: eukaryotic translation initiation factor 4E [Candidatus Neomarinimicrobiota bacterium]
MSTLQEIAMEEETTQPHALYDKWVLWAHLPHDTDWTLKSYKKIMVFTTMEEVIALYQALPEKLVKNCMLFLMREGITPTWEDKKNRNGGCFSFKIPNKAVTAIWKRLSYVLTGETISNDIKLLRAANGITISPKKTFFIIKIWISDCAHQNPRVISPIPGLSIQGCLFKKHKPEY